MTRSTFSFFCVTCRYELCQCYASCCVLYSSCTECTRRWRYVIYCICRYLTSYVSYSVYYVSCYYYASWLLCCYRIACLASPTSISKFICIRWQSSTASIITCGCYTQCSCFTLVSTIIIKCECWCCLIIMAWRYLTTSCISCIICYYHCYFTITCYVLCVFCTTYCCPTTWLHDILASC